MKTKKFDIEKAKAGAKVVTRDGRPARIICFDRQGELSIVALIAFDKYERVGSYYYNGKFDKEVDSDIDLLLVSEEKEELTGFGYALYDVLCEVEHDDEKSNAYELAKEYSQELLELARKEIFGDTIKEIERRAYDEGKASTLEEIEDKIEQIVAEKIAELLKNKTLPLYPLTPQTPNPFQPIAVLYGCPTMEQQITYGNTTTLKQQDND